MWEPIDGKAATSSFKGDGTEKYSYSLQGVKEAKSSSSRLEQSPPRSLPTRLRGQPHPAEPAGGRQSQDSPPPVLLLPSPHRFETMWVDVHPGYLGRSPVFSATGLRLNGLTMLVLL